MCFANEWTRKCKRKWERKLQAHDAHVCRWWLACVAAGQWACTTARGPTGSALRVFTRQGLSTSTCFLGNRKTSWWTLDTGQPLSHFWLFFFYVLGKIVELPFCSFKIQYDSCTPLLRFLKSFQLFLYSCLVPFKLFLSWSFCRHFSCFFYRTGVPRVTPTCIARFSDITDLIRCCFLHKVLRILFSLFRLFLYRIIFYPTVLLSGFSNIFGFPLFCLLHPFLCDFLYFLQFFSHGFQQPLQLYSCGFPHIFLNSFLVCFRIILTFLCSKIL
jgi:hypothetical protein